MPKVIYANIIWFVVIMASAINASIDRHRSIEWDGMAEQRLNYDLLFVGVFGCLCLASIVGLLNRKKWGYVGAMSFNYVIASLSILPPIAILVYALKNNTPFTDLDGANWGFNLEGLIIGIVALVFIFCMRREHVKSIF